MQNEELQRTQAELEASRARYFDLYDLAPVGYLTLSEQGLILQANLTLAKLLGVTRSALVKHPLSCFVVPEDQDINYLHFKQLFETGGPQVWEMRLARKAAAPFWTCVEATTVQDADGPSVCRAVVSDITERNRARQELLNAHRRTTAILESVSDGFNTYDREWRCTYVNPAGAKMFGKTVEELHPGIALDQVGKDALVVRGQMLHQDKSHAGIVGGHSGKEGFERCQPSGRGANPDNGTFRTRLPGWQLDRSPI